MFYTAKYRPAVIEVFVRCLYGDEHEEYSRKLCVYKAI